MSRDLGADPGDAAFDASLDAFIEGVACRCSRLPGSPEAKAHLGHIALSEAYDAIVKERSS